MIDEKYKYSELTSKIIACALEVHKTLGNGFQEAIYQRALAIEMQNAGLKFIREKVMPVFYKQQQIGTRRADFLVEDVVSVELKAVIVMDNAHLSQAKNYLEAYSIEVGLLINFASKSLDFKRLTNNNFKQINQQPFNQK